jgi:LSD1 subclass zinc finger protein
MTYLVFSGLCHGCWQPLFLYIPPGSRDTRLLCATCRERP